MKTVPTIIMQLVHIEGPLKGQIQEFSQNEITIGRHPSCDSQMPKELNYISRKHAQIIREGNRFKIKDLSTNGTYVNGQPIEETYIKDGDIIVIAIKGPKFSFLTREGTIESSDQKEKPHPKEPIEAKEPQAESRIVQKLDQIPEKKIASCEKKIQPKATPKPAPTPSPSKPKAMPKSAPPPIAPPAPSPSDAISASNQKVKVPFSIQFGAKIQSFKELPITIGKQASCHLVLDGEKIFDQHALIFYNHGDYWIKDLTGRKSLQIDGSPIETSAPLNAGGVLSLSLHGPKFKIIGGGRLGEIAEMAPEKNDPVIEESIEKPNLDVKSPFEKQDKASKIFFGRQLFEKFNFFQKKK